MTYDYTSMAANPTFLILKEAFVNYNYQYPIIMPENSRSDFYNLLYRYSGAAKRYSWLHFDLTTSGTYNVLREIILSSDEDFIAGITQIP